MIPHNIGLSNARILSTIFSSTLEDSVKPYSESNGNQSHKSNKFPFSKMNAYRQIHFLNFSLTISLALKSTSSLIYDRIDITFRVDSNEGQYA